MKRRTCFNTTGALALAARSGIDNALSLCRCITGKRWQQAKAVTLKENRSAKKVSDPRLTTCFVTCYDRSTLYIAFICNDPDIWT